MCGMVGVFSQWNLNEKEINIFHQMLYLSALRGSDSTGVMAILNDGHVDTIKNAATPAWFISSKDYQAFLEKHKGKIRGLFGHTRYATSGKIVTRNAHPFVIKNEIVMMHNGFITYAPKVNIKEFEVDSMALATSLQKHEDSVEVFQRFSGGAAVIWVDIRNETLNIFRNHHRPLSITNGGIKYLCSERKMLEWITDRNNVYGNISTVDTEVVHSWNINKLNEEVKKVNVPFVVRGQQQQHGIVPITGQKPTGIVTNANPGCYLQWNNKTQCFDNIPYGQVQQHPAVISHNTSKQKNKASWEYADAAKELPYILLSDAGPFKKEHSLDVEVYEVEKLKEGHYKLSCLPITDLWEPNDKKKYGGSNVYIFVAGENSEKQVTDLYNAHIVRGLVKNIKFDRLQKKLEDRYTVFLGDATVAVPKGAEAK